MDVVCDTHNNRVIVIKNNKIYGWFENTSNNQVAFFIRDIIFELILFFCGINLYKLVNFIFIVIK